MAVAVSATGTAVYNSSATSQSFTFSVNSGDTLLMLWLSQDATETISSVTWDSGGTNQAMSLIGSKSCPTASNGALYLYGLVNPTAGSKTLKVVQATATGLGAEIQSYTGTVTTSVAAACTNALTANGSGNNGTQNVGTAAQGGANGDMYVSGYTYAGSINSVSDTQVFHLSPAGNDSAGNRYASTGSTHSLTASITGNSSTQWAAVSCDIVAAGATTASLAATSKVATGLKSKFAGLVSLPYGETVSQVHLSASGLGHTSISGATTIAATDRAVEGPPPGSFFEVQKNSGGSSTSANIVTSLSRSTTAGNTILIFVAGAGTITTPTGFVSRNPQVNVQGFYLFEKLVATGDATDTPTLVMSGAYNAVWSIVEYHGITGYDVSSGNNGGFSALTSWTSASITPTSGQRLLVAAVTGSAVTRTDTYAAGDPQAWTNSFVGEQSVAQTGGGSAGLDSMIEGWASQQVTADGVTAYSTSASWTITPAGDDTAPAAIIASYTLSSGGASTQSLAAHAVIATKAAPLLEASAMLLVQTQIFPQMRGGLSTIIGQTLSAAAAITVTSRAAVLGLASLAGNLAIRFQDEGYTQVTAPFRQTLSALATIANRLTGAVSSKASISGSLSIKISDRSTSSGLVRLAADTIAAITASPSGHFGTAIPGHVTAIVKASANSVSHAMIAAATRIKVSAKMAPPGALAMMASIVAMVKGYGSRSGLVSIRTETALHVTASPKIDAKAKLAANDAVAVSAVGKSTPGLLLSARTILTESVRGFGAGQAKLSGSITTAMSAQFGGMAGVAAIAGKTVMAITSTVAVALQTPHISLAANMMLMTFSKAFAVFPARSRVRAHRRHRRVSAPPRRNNWDED